MPRHRYPPSDEKRSRAQDRHRQPDTPDSVRPSRNAVPLPAFRLTAGGVQDSKCLILCRIRPGSTLNPDPQFGNFWATWQPIEEEKGGGIELHPIFLRLTKERRYREKPVQVDPLIASRFIWKPIFRFWPLHDLRSTASGRLSFWPMVTVKLTLNPHTQNRRVRHPISFPRFASGRPAHLMVAATYWRSLPVTQLGS
jgi:hypothetical protein